MYPRGLGLGGSSLINGMIYMRGQAEDYNSWAATLNDPSWNWDNVLQLFKCHEDYHGGNSEHHNQGGNWTVEKQRLQWDVLEAFKHSCNQVGIPNCDDFNKGNNFGVGYFDVSQRKGWRLNTYKAFIKNNTKSNLTVKNGILIDSLLFNEDSKSKSHNGPVVCTGVKGLDSDNRPITYHASKEVILCSGSIGSVQILGEWMSR